MEPDREQAYRRRIATLEAQLGQALQRLAELEAENARLKKISSNSSKPPSSDIVKPPGPPTPEGGGKIGGQQSGRAGAAVRGHRSATDSGDT